MYFSTALSVLKSAVLHQSVSSSLAVRRRSGVRRRCIRRWAIEPLKSRIVPSTLTVMNTDEAGAGSLRAAIEQPDEPVPRRRQSRLEWGVESLHADGHLGPVLLA
jgi:hypothetical protein